MIFIYKQKTAYESLSSLVGSEMSIRNRIIPLPSAWRGEKIGAALL